MAGEGNTTQTTMIPFDGNLTCAHPNGTKITDKTEVLFTKNVASVNDQILEMAMRLYESNAFDNYPNKSPEQFAVDAITRAKAFFKIAKKKYLV
jgi:hypothetical protein